jgi:hypothetical protein
MSPYTSIQILLGIRKRFLLEANFAAVSRMSNQCGVLNTSQHYRFLRPVTEIPICYCKSFHHYSRTPGKPIGMLLNIVSIKNVLAVLQNVPLGSSRKPRWTEIEWDTSHSDICRWCETTGWSHRFSKVKNRNYNGWYKRSWSRNERNNVLDFIIPNIYIVTCYGCGSVTNNSTWIRIGYRIYSLCYTQVTILLNTLALVASWILLSELHCTDVSLRLLTDEDWLTPKPDRRRLTRALCCLPRITLGRPNRKPGRSTVGCYATNTLLPTLSCYATKTGRPNNGCYVTKSTLVVSVSMEIFNYGCLVTAAFGQTRHNMYSVV